MREVRCPLLVGRDAEMARLVDATERACSGTGQVVFLQGEAGVGKTRMATETMTLARSFGMDVLDGRAGSAPTPPPYRPLSEAFLSRWRGLDPPPGPLRAGLRPAADVLVPTWATATRGVPPTIVTVGEAALALLDAAGGPGSLLVLEDLHWSDPESLDVLEYLAGQLADRAIVVVATLRSGEGSPAERLVRTVVDRRCGQALTLTELEAPAVAAAVAAVLDTTTPPEGLVAGVTAWSGGLPFLVEELLASAIESGALVRAGSGWRLRDGWTVTVPGSFAADVADRVAALPAPARLVVQVAAVLGERFDWRLVDAATFAGEPAGAVVEALRTAVRCRLVEDDRDSGQFRFRHALTRLAVLDSLLAPERLAIARRALAALDAAGEPPDHDRLGLAAGLAESADDRKRAFELRLAAGRAAIDRGALTSARASATDALRLARTADELVEAQRSVLDAGVAAGDPAQVVPLGERLVERLSAHGAPAPDIVEVRHRVAAAAVAGHDWDRAATQLAAAQRCLPDAPDAIGARAATLRGEIALGRHDPHGALACARRARAAATRAGRDDLEADALELMGRAVRPFDLDEAERWLAAAVDAAGATGSVLRRARAAHELATIDAVLARPADRMLAARELAVQAGAPGLIAMIDQQLAVLHWKRFELADARAAARRAGEAGDRFGLALLAPLAGIVGGCVDAVLGRRAEAVAAFEQVRPAMDDEIEASGRGNLLAVAALADEDRPAARAELDRALLIAPGDSASARSPFRGLHALLRAVDDETGADGTVAELSALTTLDVVAAQYGRLARAVLAGRAGDHAGAADLFAEADDGLVATPWLRHLGRRLVAEAAIADGWGEPGTWLREALVFFTGTTDEIATACRSLLRHGGLATPRDDGVPPSLAARGVSRRELDVLVLLARGLSNREIAARLVLSHRTVEKHIERIMGKTATTRRTQLVALMGRLPADPDR